MNLAASSILFTFVPQIDTYRFHTRTQASSNMQSILQMKRMQCAALNRPAIVDIEKRAEDVRLRLIPADVARLTVADQHA